MKLLIDNALSPRVAEGLRTSGFDVVHVRDFHLESATDEEVFRFAEDQGRVIISADTDFGALLALRKQASPSFVLVRKDAGNRPDQILALLVRYLPEVERDLEQGAIITISDYNIRVRRLPIQ